MGWKGESNRRMMYISPNSQTQLARIRHAHCIRTTRTSLTPVAAAHQISRPRSRRMGESASSFPCLLLFLFLYFVSMFTTNYIVFKFSFIFLLLESNFILYLPPLLIFCFPQTALFVFDFYFISHFTVDIFSFVLFWVRRQLYHFPFFFLLSFSVFLLFSDMSQPLHLILLSFIFHLTYCILSLFCYRTQLLFFPNSLPYSAFPSYAYSPLPFLFHFFFLSSYFLLINICPRLNTSHRRHSFQATDASVGRLPGRRCAGGGRHVRAPVGGAAREAAPPSQK